MLQYSIQLKKMQIDIFVSQSLTNPKNNNILYIYIYFFFIKICLYLCYSTQLKKIMQIDIFVSQSPKIHYVIGVLALCDVT